MAVHIYNSFIWCLGLSWAFQSSSLLHFSQTWLRIRAVPALCQTLLMFLERLPGPSELSSVLHTLRSPTCKEERQWLPVSPASQLDFPRRPRLCVRTPWCQPGGPFGRRPAASAGPFKGRDVQTVWLVLECSRRSEPEGRLKEAACQVVFWGKTKVVGRDGWSDRGSGANGEQKGLKEGDGSIEVNLRQLCRKQSSPPGSIWVDLDNFRDQLGSDLRCSQILDVSSQVKHLGPDFSTVRLRQNRRKPHSVVKTGSSWFTNMAESALRLFNPEQLARDLFTVFPHDYHAIWSFLTDK